MSCVSMSCRVHFCCANDSIGAFTGEIIRDYVVLNHGLLPRERCVLEQLEANQ